MQKRYNILFFFIIVFICQTNQAQTKTIYKDVLLNGKPAKLNPATGEFIIKDSKGKDSIVNPRNRNNILPSYNELHTVKKGETLFFVAKKYGLSLQEIKALNKLEKNEVTIGQKLKIKNTDDINKKDSNNYWIVAKGQTLYHISTKTGVSVKELKRLNQLNSNNISIGQKLYFK